MNTKNEEKPFRLKGGKYYWRRDGKIVGPLLCRIGPHSRVYEDSVRDIHYTPDGLKLRFRGPATEDPADLVVELSEDELNDHHNTNALAEKFTESEVEESELVHVWPVERRYSEREVIEYLQKYRYDLSAGTTPYIGDTTGDWFKARKDIK